MPRAGKDGLLNWRHGMRALVGQNDLARAAHWEVSGMFLNLSDGF